jgi:hypothetical protein
MHDLLELLKMIPFHFGIGRYKVYDFCTFGHNTSFWFTDTNRLPLRDDTNNEE